MKYKVGDKVKIKTWETMKKEFGLSGISIDCHDFFTQEMEQIVNHHQDRILTIEVCSSQTIPIYYMQEDNNFSWNEQMFEKEEDIEPTNRFELMDI